MAITNKPLDFLSGGGEMGERIRNYNWKKNPLGDPEQWDSNLKTCIRIMLNSRQPIWIGWGQELIYLYNEAYIDIVRGKHPNALGQPLAEVWKDIWNDIEDPIKSVYTSGQGKYYESQLFIMHRSGFPEEVYYTYSFTPIFDAAGKTNGIICYNTSDTERILNQRAIETLSRLNGEIAVSTGEKEVLKKAAAAIASNDRDFPFAAIYKIDQQISIAELCSAGGFNNSTESPPSIISRDESSSFSKHIFSAVSDGNVKYFSDAKPWDGLPKGAWEAEPDHFVIVPINLPDKKNTSAVLLIGLNPFRKFDDTLMDLVLLISRQLSLGLSSALSYEMERQRAEAMEELDKAKTLFFTNISHEFRTPITLLLGNLEEIYKDPGTSKKNIERLDTANRNATRLLKLVNSLLDFSRIQSGRQQATYVLTDMVDFTRSLISHFQSVIERAGMELVISTDEIIRPVYVDRQMWEKIVFNLMSNAFKFTLKGTITVSLSSDDLHAILKVTDTGTGIPEKELPFMFDRFHRVQNAAGRTFEGTGIGLSFVKELVALHGGTITVTSRVGEGSQFTVSVPFGKDHLPEMKIFDNSEIADDIIPAGYIEEALSLIQHPESFSTQQRNEAFADTIMIVDDNADMRNYLQSLLSPYYNTITAANGLDALHKIREKHPSLILSDVMMPVMDGNQMLHELKSSALTSEIPVIMLTARAGEESRNDGFDLGAEDYLVKPFSAKELLVRVRSQLQLKRKQQDAIRKINEGEKEIQRFISQAPFSVIVMEGRDYIVKVANEKSLEYLNIKADQIINRSMFEAYPEVVAQGYRQLLDSVMNSGTPFIGRETEAQFSENGQQKTMYLDFVYEPMRNPDNEVTGIMALTIDVTEKVLARKKIEESEEQLRELVDQRTKRLQQQNDFIEHILNNAREWISVWNNKSELIMINDSYRAISNKSREEMIGKTFAELMGQSDTFQESCLLRALNGEYVKVDPYFSKLNGRYIQTFYTPVIDHNGKVEFVIIMAHDLTEILSAQEELKKSQEHFSLLFNISPVAITITTVEEGVILDVNPAWEKLMKKSKENVIGKTTIGTGVTTINKRKNITDKIKENNGEIYGIDIDFIVDQNEIIYTIASIVTIVLDGVPCYLTCFFDITERKNVEKLMLETAKELADKNEALEEMNNQLKSFNYIASHDLQEPLRKIKTFISLIRGKNQSKDKEEVYLDKINNAAGRMALLIEAVLTYSNISRSDEQLSEVDLNKTLEDVTTDFELMLQEKNGIIENNKLPVIQGIPVQMHQLFYNLISNSLKFSKDHPAIKIESTIISGEEMPDFKDVDLHQQYARISFRDNGIGFDPKYKDVIFSLFHRLHGKSEYQGTGIGLSIAKKIVENHKGFIAVDSIPGDGSVFNIWLPV